MKKKIILLASIFTTIFSGLNAQQDKILTHFIFDKMSINPGETGLDQSNNSICATSIYRNQWDKVNGAPNSAVFNIESNLDRFIPVNLGLSFFHDAIGFNRQNNLLLNASFPVAVPGYGRLGLGLGVGMINFGMSPVWVPPTTAIDPTLPVGFSATNLDLNFGVYWKGDNDYYVGLSSTHLNESLLKQTVGTISQTYQTARHYYIMGGKKFLDVAGGDIDAQMLMKTDFIKMQVEFNARYMWRGIAYGGLNYRTSDAISLMAGWMPVRNVTIGYAYDITTNKLSGISKGSHEILLKYCYLLPPPPITKSNHPRWL